MIWFKNEKANQYLRGAIWRIQRALSEMSDALFEITTEPLDYEKSEDDDEDRAIPTQMRVRICRKLRFRFQVFILYATHIYNWCAEKMK